jgi:hypothetical protein
VDCGESLERMNERLNGLVVPPEANLHTGSSGIRDKMDLDMLPDRDLRHGEHLPVELDPAIGVDGSRLSKAEDVLEGCVGLRKGEGTEERLTRPSCPFESHVRDLARRRMDALVVVTIDLVLEDGANIVEGGELIEGRRADRSILEPAVGPLDFALGLRRERIGDVHAQDLHDLLPLGIRLVGLKDGVVPEAVPLVDVAEDTKGIDIIAKREAIAAEKGFSKKSAKRILRL